MKTLVPVDFVSIAKSSLFLNTFWDIYDIFASCGDGHCFVYSICKSYNSQLPLRRNIEYTHVLDMLSTEVLLLTFYYWLQY